MSKFIKSYRKIYITRKKTANCYLPVYVTIFYICLFLSTGMYYGQDGKNVDSRVIEATVLKIVH